MIFIDELQDNILYKKKFYLPINKDDKRKGSAVFLLSPDFKESLNILKNNLMNTKYFNSYYIEKDITYFINQENATLNRNLDYINETSISNTNNSEESYKIDNNLRLRNINEYEINNEYMRYKDIIFTFPVEESVMIESDKMYNPLLKKILYNERYRTPKEVLNIYSQVKDEFNKNNINIFNTFLSYKRYKEFNLFIDLSFYNETFFKNNVYKLDRGVNLYFEFINRFIQDSRIEENGYNKKTVIIPVNGWNNSDKDFTIYKEDINPISLLLRYMKTDLDKMKEQWKDINFIFLGNNAYFKLNFNTIEKEDFNKTRNLINKLVKNDNKDALEPNDSKEAIKADIIEKIEKSRSIELKSLTGDNKNISKDELLDKIDNADSISDDEANKNELVDRIDKAASMSKDIDQALEILDQDDFLKEIIIRLSDKEENIKINNSRSVRMSKLNDSLMDKEIRKRSIKELLSYKQIEELPTTSLNIDSVNSEWEQLKYVNFEKSYDIDADIMKILEFFSSRSLPVMMRDIKVEDTSTSEDWIYTYVVNCEDYNGQRFTLKFDIPKFKDNRFMYLRGNEKIINGQLLNIPISKTGEDTVQIVSNYNKIFIRTYGTSTGKSFHMADVIIKTLNKIEKNKSIKISYGDNRKICSKYELPIDYIDISSEISKIETKDHIIYFNQDEIREKYNNIIKDKNEIPFLYNKTDNKIMYIESGNFSIFLYQILINNPLFKETSETVNLSNKYSYSQASILGAKIPVIIIMAYHVGLTEAMKIAGIEFTIEKKGVKYDKLYNDRIRFKDATLLYRLDYNSSLLMNGLKDCDTLNYSIAEVNDKAIYLDFLDGFGGRIKADGLDNFLDLMIDPITMDTINIYKLPEDYLHLLAYSNKLLEDNKNIRHTNITGNRLRTNEIIAACLYSVLAKSYGEYKNKSKRVSKGNTMTIKQSAVIDLLLSQPTSSDASILNALLDIENMNSISFKGLSGMNSDRAYDLDKRTFDKSMTNVLALSTGFAGNVGITRQATIDMSIKGTRGIINPAKDSTEVGLKSLAMTEALTPFSVNRDDPFRSAMTFVQTAKHTMRTEKMSPRLITNGADEALPYMISNNFAFKSKQSGKIIEKTDEYMIVQYKDNTNDYIDLSEKIIKNSAGGFFSTIKLDSDLKVGNSFKPNEILAYDNKSFSNTIGNNDNIGYNAGTLVKLAILNTDEGFEDSAIFTEWLSESMASEVVNKVPKILDKNTNVYDIVKIGQEVQEGDILITFQNAFDDNDINILMKNLGEDEKTISELGRIKIKSKYTGIIQDIKIYRTVELDELSPSLKAIVSKHEKTISNKRKIMKQHNIDMDYTLDPNYKLEAIGKLKHARNSVMIEFYIKYKDKLSIGDKIIYDTALKGVGKDVIHEGKEPTSEFRPTEKMDTLLSLSSVDGRMVTSITNSGCINKILIELDRKIKGILDIPIKDIRDMK